MKWEKVKLGDIATFSNGINFNKTAYAKGIKLIGVSNFGDRFYPDYSQLQEVKKDIVRLEDCLRNGDIVFVRSNGNKELVGRCMLVKNPTERVTYSGFCIRARLNDTDRYDPVYFTYYFKSKAFRRAVSGTAVGANIQNLSQARLSNHECRVPSIEVQHRIADILSAYDDLIENNQKQIKLLEEAAQRLYKEWFVDLRFPGHENTKIVDGVPEGWKKNCAEKFFEITIGKTPPRTEKRCFTTGKNGIPWVSIADMGNSGMFVLNTAENLTDDAIKQYNVKVIPKNTVLLSFKLTVGRVAIAPNDICTNEAIAHFKGRRECEREYIYFYLKNFHYDELGSTSSISKAVNSKIIKAMPFIMPSEKLLKEYSSKTKDIFDLIICKQKMDNDLKIARDRILHKLMSGEMEV